MGDLIDDLLRYSRIQHRAIEPAPVALPPLLDRLLEDLAGELQARNLTVTRDLAVSEVIGEGVGLDMKYPDRIFGIFERLHRQEDYPGTGEGSVFFLAIPARQIVDD